MGVERTWFAAHDEAADIQSADSALPPEQTTEPEVVAITSGTQRESVAVLPFTVMSSGEDDGYFADGLTNSF